MKTEIALFFKKSCPEKVFNELKDKGFEIYERSVAIYGCPEASPKDGAEILKDGIYYLCIYNGSKSVSQVIGKTLDGIKPVCEKTHSIY